MAINIMCTQCKGISKRGTKTCKKCGSDLTRKRKYRVRVKRASDGKWISKTSNTYELAISIEAKLKTQSVENLFFDVPRTPPTFSAIWEEYLEWAKANKRSWIDDHYRWRLHIEPPLGRKRMDHISPRDIERILERMRKLKAPSGKKYAPATIKHVLVLTSRIFNWAIDRELYSGGNPCAKIPAPKFQNAQTRTLTRKEIKRLLAVLDTWENERATLIVKFALYTGRRKGEILKLEWRDINMQRRLVTFRGETTKNGKIQTAPLTQKACEVLTRAYQIRTCEYVFPSGKGTRYGESFDGVWRRIRRKAEINVRFHDLRHTFASYLASSGQIDIYMLKNLLGHSTLDMTQRYAHLIDGAFQRAACTADSVFMDL